MHARVAERERERDVARLAAGWPAALLRPRYTAGQVTVGVSAGLCTLGTAVAASRQPAIASAISSQVRPGVGVAVGGW